MREHGMRNGLLFTADPYSPIINSADKNTALLFGDAATCSWIGENPLFTTGRFTFGTIGSENAELTCPAGGQLFMNGRAIFNFAAKHVPGDIRQVLAANELSVEKVDRFIFHQGSKFIVDTLTRLLQLPADKVALAIADCGNTVSSSIPLILAGELTKPENQKIVLCGFGAGLSWSSTVLTRTTLL
jgi:3-oxoacyl-[acyl-carrier-protein] synthase-3